MKKKLKTMSGALQDVNMLPENTPTFPIPPESSFRSEFGVKSGGSEPIPPTQKNPNSANFPQFCIEENGHQIERNADTRRSYALRSANPEDPPGRLTSNSPRCRVLHGTQRWCSAFPAASQQGEQEKITENPENELQVVLVGQDLVLDTETPTLEEPILSIAKMDLFVKSMLVGNQSISSSMLQAETVLKLREDQKETLLICDVERGHRGDPSLLTVPMPEEGDEVTRGLDPPNALAPPRKHDRDAGSDDSDLTPKRLLTDHFMGTSMDVDPADCLQQVLTAPEALPGGGGQAWQAQKAIPPRLTMSLWLTVQRPVAGQPWRTRQGGGGSTASRKGPPRVRQCVRRHLGLLGGLGGNPDRWYAMRSWLHA